MIMLIAMALFAGTFPAMAQNSFPTPGGASVPGIVVMCLNGSQKAVPCIGTFNGGPDSTFTTPSGATVGSGVSMCLAVGLAVPCGSIGPPPTSCDLSSTCLLPGAGALL